MVGRARCHRAAIGFTVLGVLGGLVALGGRVGVSGLVGARGPDGFDAPARMRRPGVELTLTGSAATESALPASAPPAAVPAPEREPAEAAGIVEPVGGAVPTGPPVPLARPADRSARPADVLPALPPPASIRIGAIGVDALVVATGVRPGTAELDVPAEGDLVGWFGAGPRPGEAGSAVLAGHVDWSGRPAVFYDLVELPIGAVIAVTAADGVERHFAVTGRRSFPKGQLPPALYRRTGAPVLTLITCGGSFDDDAGSYRENVVVEAAPV